MDINAIRKWVQAGQYLVKSHVIQHALKEGFERKHVVQAILTGSIIEAYPNEYRALVCGRATVEGVQIYLHVVCEYQ